MKRDPEAAQEPPETSLLNVVLGWLVLLGFAFWGVMWTWLWIVENRIIWPRDPDQMARALYHDLGLCERENVARLLRRGADPNREITLEPRHMVDPDLGSIPIDVVGRCDDPELIELLLEAGAEFAPEHYRSMLYHAVHDGHPEMLDMFLVDDFPIDAVLFSGGRTLLHTAAASPQPAIVRQLLEAGADPDVLDAEDRTPLVLAENGLAYLSGLLGIIGDSLQRPGFEDTNNFAVMRYYGLLEVIDILQETDGTE